MPPPRNRIWLSVDWDYFCRQPKAWWDTGASEKLGADVTTWAVRATLSRIYGTDIRSTTSLRHAAPSPGCFWDALERFGMTFDQVEVIGVRESHKHAYGLFRGQQTENVELVNFDAHHDLLYASKFFATALEKSKADCGNWHMLTLLRYPKLRSVTIYPHWKGWAEWNKTLQVLRDCSKGDEIVKFLHRQTRANVWPRVKLPQGRVEKVFICRSGAWTPPWHDRAFLRFVESVEEKAGVISSIGTWEGYDEVAPRPFSWAPVRKIAKLEARLLQKSVYE